MSPVRWRNASVLALGGDDPIEVITNRARVLALRAMDLGWEGPPFDPMRLAELLEIDLVPNASVRDARVGSSRSGKAVIEFNPTKSNGRIRYSIAHEIAHTLFPDWGERTRHRGGTPGSKDESEWQLESLCNLAAAELLMPFGDFELLAHLPLDINELVTQQRRFDVSMEALLLRTVKLRADASAAFCASRHADGVYRLDYVVGSRAWMASVRAGMSLAPDSLVGECTAIGYTASGTEQWNKSDGDLLISCVGIPPYPDSRVPRVCGTIMLQSNAAHDFELTVRFVKGDALKPRGSGTRVIVHIVNDKSLIWGGASFAAALRRIYPGLQESFRNWAVSTRPSLRLGRNHLAIVSDEVTVASMVAQEGYGPSQGPRIRYEALRACLVGVANYARERKASVHMPRIGTGNAGGRWEVIQEIVDEYLIKAGVPVTVYSLP